jgi:hypothetical protein
VFDFSSAYIAFTGHSGSHNPQSIQSSGLITSMFGPSWKQSTGQTVTHFVSLHPTQGEPTTNVID